MKYLALLALLCTACGETTEPKPPQTAEQLQLRMDQLATELNWVQVDMYKLGVRDELVSVRSPNVPPHYFRLPMERKD